MRRQRHLQQAASRFLRQSLVNHLSREQSCLQMIDRTFPSCPSSWSEPNLSYWIILSRIRFRFLSEPRGWATHDMAVRTKRTGCPHNRGVRLCGERLSRKLTTHAFPTQTFSSLRAKSFCNVLLLSSPCLVLDRLEPPSLRKSPGTRASEPQAFAFMGMSSCRNTYIFC